MAAVALGATGLLFASATSAGADGSTSPPVGGTPTSCSSSSTLTVSGSTPVSATLTIPSTCAFLASSAVTVTFLGGSQTVNADASGIISLPISATDPHLSVNGGTFQSTVYGVNTIVATGTNASGATNTATFLVDLEQNGTGASSGGGLALTGADLAALIGAALALILLGTGIVLYTRRRADQVHSG